MGQKCLKKVLLIFWWYFIYIFQLRNVSFGRMQDIELFTQSLGEVFFQL